MQPFLRAIVGIEALDRYSFGFLMIAIYCDDSFLLELVNLTSLNAQYSKNKLELISVLRYFS